jgi:hypothetical protein
MLLKSLNGRDHSRDAGIDGRIILKYILRKQGVGYNRPSPSLIRPYAYVIRGIARYGWIPTLKGLETPREVDE